MALNFDSSQQMDRFFLLELLVDNLCINYTKLDVDKSAIDVLEEASVRFYFQDFPPVDVKEEDFCKLSDYSGTSPSPFRSGRSCVFFLQNLSPNQQKFQVGVEVYGCVQGKPQLLLARTCTDLGKYFNNLLDSILNLCQKGPVIRAAKNTYPLVGSNGVDVGKITLFIRFSCFGKVDKQNKGPCADLGGIGDRSGGESQTKMGGMYPGGDTSKGLLNDSHPGFQSSQALLGSGGLLGTGGAAIGMGMPPTGKGPGLQGMGTGQGFQGMGIGQGFQGMGLGPGFQGMGISQGYQGMMPGGPGLQGMGMTPYQVMSRISEYSPENSKGQEQTSKPCIEDEEKLAEKTEEEKDVLVLKIGNKNKVGKPPKLLVELKTPKLKFDEIKTEERQCQYLESDIAPPPKNKDKGKKKGKAGKKGKKK